MPWLPMYLTAGDVELLVAHLDDDPDLAWLVGRGSGQWIAQERHAELAARLALWHVPSGPLPLVGPPGGPDSFVDDPWQGWTQARPSAYPTAPSFGVTCPGVYWLNLRTDPDRLHDGAQLGLSSFEWIGNHYRTIGHPASPATEKHWRTLRKWVVSVGRRIPRSGDLDGPKPEIYAFPAALAAIEAGATRAKNPRG